jgi:predicted aspartyl protease
MRFAYQGYPVSLVGSSRLQVVYRPVIPIRLIGPGGDASAYGLLDTGADDTLLPLRLAAALGVEIKPALRTRIAGIGGIEVSADFAKIDLELGRRKTFYRWSATVGFYDGFKTILVQSGVLEFFLASFNHRAKVATLQPDGKLPLPVHTAP